MSGLDCRDREAKLRILQGRLLRDPESPALAVRTATVALSSIDLKHLSAGFDDEVEQIILRFRDRI